MTRGTVRGAAAERTRFCSRRRIRVHQRHQRRRRGHLLATLGSLVANNDRSHGLASDYEDAYNAATRALNEAYGPARTLRRTTPVTDGPVYARATAVAAASGL